MDNRAPYQVIARKYRPQTFATVVGQEAIVTTLKNALRFNRLAHAYLFCGCRGTGKTTLARVFAKALNCLHPSEDFEPCNACPSCLDITSGKSLDVLEIDGASNRGIDDIRQINETVGYAPAIGKYKIYIIDEVHMLTKEAFNALLKTLEEPPSHVKFFFATTEPHKILPTILSRCQRFDLNRIAFDTLKEKLLWITQDLHVSCDEEVLSLIATLSEGSLRDAESLLDQIICYADHPITLAKVSSTLGLMPRSVFFELDKAFENQNLSYAFELTSEIFSSGKDLSYFLDHLTEHYRALLKLKLDPSLTFPTLKLKQQYLESLPFYTEEQCVYILDFLIQAQQQINKTPFKRVHLEMQLLHLIRSKNRLTLPSLVKRLMEIEKQLKESGEGRVVIQQVPEKKEVVIEKIQPDPEPVLENRIPQEVLIEEKSDSKELATQVVSKPVLENRTPQKVLIEEKPASEGEVLANTPSCKEEEFPSLALEEAEHPLDLPEKPSLDELLISKIQKKLDSLPQEAPLSSPLLLSKAAWEIKAVQGESLELGIIEEISTQKVEVYQNNLKDQELGKEAPIAQGQGSSENHNSEAKPTPSTSDSSVFFGIKTPELSKESSPQGCHYDTLIRFAAVELEGIINTSTK